MGLRRARRRSCLVDRSTRRRRIGDSSAAASHSREHGRRRSAACMRLYRDAGRTRAELLDIAHPTIAEPRTAPDGARWVCSDDARHLASSSAPTTRSGTSRRACIPCWRRRARPTRSLVINNASTDADGRRGARRFRDVRVVDEPRKGLVVARETGAAEARGTSARLPRRRLPRAADVARAHRAAFRARPGPRRRCPGPYRFYDWDWWGRALIRAYDYTLAPATQVLVKHLLRIGTIFYGGNFAVRRAALEAHRRLRHVDRVPRRRHQPRPAAVRGRQGLARTTTAISTPRRAATSRWARARCSGCTSATSRRKLLHHRPKDTSHVDVRI